MAEPEVTPAPAPEVSEEVATVAEPEVTPAPAPEVAKMSFLNLEQQETYELGQEEYAASRTASIKERIDRHNPGELNLASDVSLNTNQKKLPEEIQKNLKEEPEKKKAPSQAPAQNVCPF